MPAHLRGLFTGNAANNLIDPWLARSRQEIMGKIKSLDKGEFLGHVEHVVERCLSGVTLHPVESGRAVRIGKRGLDRKREVWGKSVSVRVSLEGGGIVK